MRRFPAVSIFATGLLERLTTRIYFPDEAAANARDPLLAGLDDPSSLIARPDGDGPEAAGPPPAPSAAHPTPPPAEPR